MLKLRPGTAKLVRMKRLARIAGAAAVLLILFSPSFAILKTGDKVVPFSLKGVDGKDYTVTMENGKLALIIAETAGGETKVAKSCPAALLVDFWATYCIPCRKAMPRLQRLDTAHAPADGRSDGGLRVVGIALDEAGGKIVKPFGQKLAITYPLLADRPSAAPAEGLAATVKDIKKRYQVQEIPVVYLIDSSGTIVHAHVGSTEKQLAELETAIKALLGGGKR